MRGAKGGGKGAEKNEGVNRGGEGLLPRPSRPSLSWMGPTMRRLAP